MDTNLENPIIEEQITSPKEQTEVTNSELPEAGTPEQTEVPINEDELQNDSGIVDPITEPTIDVTNQPDNEIWYQLRSKTNSTETPKLIKVVLNSVNEEVQIPSMAYNKRVKLLSLPKNLKAVRQNMCSSCTDLKTVIIGEGTSVIEDQAFILCSQLENVVIPNTVETIGINAFHMCRSLTSITLPESLKIISNNALSNTGITSLTIPQNVQKIGSMAFYGSYLTDLYFAGTVEQWEAIELEQGWDHGIDVESVICTDGVVTLDEFRL